MKRPYGNGKTVRIYARVTPEVSEKLKKHGVSTAEAIETVLKEINKTCEWTKIDDPDDTGVYETECGDVFSTLDGNLEDNHIDYCLFCGGSIKVYHK